jgi:hypothetical protein
VTQSEWVEQRCHDGMSCHVIGSQRFVITKVSNIYSRVSLENSSSGLKEEVFEGRKTFADVAKYNERECGETLETEMRL